MENVNHLYFLSWENLSYSRSGVLYHGLKDKNVNYRAINFPKKNYIKTFKTFYELKSEANGRSVIVVGSPCAILAIICRIAWPRAKIIYDSGWPLIDGLLSREYPLLVKLISYVKIYIVDFLAFNFSNLILVESELQKKSTRRKFSIRNSKISVSYTGFNEAGVDISDFEIANAIEHTKQIIFRGKYNLESGLDFLAVSSHFLDPEIRVVIISPNLPRELEFSPNVKIISHRLSDKQLARHYKNSVISLGQLGNSDRPSRSIPHKFYESIFFEVPYLTRRSAGIEELLPSDNQVIFFENQTPSEFARFIADQLINTQSLKSRAERAKEVYLSKFSQNQIVDNFILCIKDKFNLRVNCN